MTEAQFDAGQKAASDGPLTGLRVLDVSSVIMGPWATQNLADLGADVICVEAAGGDPVRFLGEETSPFLCGVALNILRNKRNVALDLKNPKGREAFLKIAATCDVVITNLRPATRRKLGISYEDVRAVKPDIIYCHAQGWSIESGRQDDPAYDDVIQTGGGMASVFQMQQGKPAISPCRSRISLAALPSISPSLLHCITGKEPDRVSRWKCR